MSLKDLMSKPAEAFTPPPTLPAGTYVFLVKGYKFDKSKQKKTDFVRYELIPMSAEVDVDAEALTTYGSLQKRSMNLDFYLTDDALFRLTNFFQSLGFNTKLPLSELVELPVNHSIRATVGHTMSQDGKNTYANIGDVLGSAD